MKVICDCTIHAIDAPNCRGVYITRASVERCVTPAFGLVISRKTNSRMRVPCLIAAQAFSFQNKKLKRVDIDVSFYFGFGGQHGTHGDPTGTHAVKCHDIPQALHCSHKCLQGLIADKQCVRLYSATDGCRQATVGVLQVALTTRHMFSKDVVVAIFDRCRRSGLLTSASISMVSDDHWPGHGVCPATAVRHGQPHQSSTVCYT